MKKKTVLAAMFVFMLFSSVAQAICESSGCSNFNGSAFVTGSESQAQRFDFSPNGKKNESTFHQDERHSAIGESTGSSSVGSIALSDAQAMENTRVENFSGGGFAVHGAQGSQSMTTNALLCGNCTLSISGENKFDSVVKTDQGKDSMSSSINTRDSGKLNLSGQAPNGSLNGKHNISYENRDGRGNYQTGSAKMEVQVNHHSALPQD